MSDIQWVKDRTLLGTSEGFEITSEGKTSVLTIRRAETSSAGQYNAIAGDNLIVSFELLLLSII